jgi:hypothetical protein
MGARAAGAGGRRRHVRVEYPLSTPWVLTDLAGVGGWGTTRERRRRKGGRGGVPGPVCPAGPAPRPGTNKQTRAARAEMPKEKRETHNTWGRLQRGGGSRRKGGAHSAGYSAGYSKGYSTGCSFWVPYGVLKGYSLRRTDLPGRAARAVVARHSDRPRRAGGAGAANKQTNKQTNRSRCEKQTNNCAKNKQTTVRNQTKRADRAETSTQTNKQTNKQPNRSTNAQRGREPARAQDDESGRRHRRW